MTTIASDQLDKETTSPDKELAIQARNVGLFYNNKRKLDFRGKHRFWALKDISFDLYKGECLGVLGSNGAGKSTLMRVIAGIHKPDRGTLNTFGNTVSLLTIGAGFLNYLSGRDNMILSAQLLGLSKKQALERLEKMIDFSGLGEFVNEPVNSYSTGMRARLGFSVAIESDPDVLLIDEILGVGDKDFQKKSSAIMQDLIKSGKTIVLISHNAATIAELADRAIIIKKGRTVCSGTPEEVAEVYNAESDYEGLQGTSNNEPQTSSEEAEQNEDIQNENEIRKQRVELSRNSSINFTDLSNYNGPVDPLIDETIRFIEKGNHDDLQKIIRVLYNKKLRPKDLKDQLHLLNHISLCESLGASHRINASCASLHKAIELEDTNLVEKGIEHLNNAFKSLFHLVPKSSNIREDSTHTYFAYYSTLARAAMFRGDFDYLDNVQSDIVTRAKNQSSIGPGYYHTSRNVVRTLTFLILSSAAKDDIVASETILQTIRFSIHQAIQKADTDPALFRKFMQTTRLEVFARLLIKATQSKSDVSSKLHELGLAIFLEKAQIDQPIIENNLNSFIRKQLR